ncbi:hypothetical protein GE061_014412 [Apolygus lucorum]|uniref:HTH psq-type domain-containing protein n=1 Tax=Apolygus lucorum TaxID=248454 RepID=A0A8S9XUK9_APOLU|nr:hypothetical protein GE061_014412 [Apolygus lucorum]
MGKPLPAKKKLLYNIEYLENAVQAVRSGRMSFRRASEEYAVPLTTLHDRVKNKGTQNFKVGRPQTIQIAEEALLVLGEWKKKNRGVVPKVEFPGLLKQAMAKLTNASENLISGFRATGIHPLSLDAVLAKFPEFEKNLDDNVNVDHEAWADSFETFLKDNIRPKDNPKSKTRGKKLNLRPGTGVKVKDLSRQDFSDSDSTAEQEMDLGTSPGTSFGH